MRPVLEAASMTKSSKFLPLVVQKVVPLGKKHAEILFTAPTGVREQAFTDDNVAAAITHIYNGKVRLCENTVTRIFDGARDVFRAFVAANTPVMPYETASAEGFVNVANNMFSDADDNLWEVSGDADNKVLRRLGNDDLSAVLSERRSRSVATAVAAIDVATSTKRHDAVMFFDTASEELQFGIMVDKDGAFVPNDAGTDGEVIKVLPEAIVAHVAHDMDAPAFRNAPETAASKAIVLEYYRKLYGQNSAFYKRLKDLIDSNLKLAA